MDTTRDGGTIPPFRLLCQVARAYGERDRNNGDSSSGYMLSRVTVIVCKSFISIS
ncbi:hypothetical protein [Nostoc sp.]|uniref:hypothetical protein n=1 Tax=Nostoc sp. TaxID=1180 RepID=UPI002FF4D1C6